MNTFVFAIIKFCNLEPVVLKLKYIYHTKATANLLQL